MPRVSQSREKTAVLLDFGGVLVLPSVEPVRSALSGLDEQLSDEVLERAFYGGIAAIDRRGPFASEEGSTETYVAGFLAELGRTSPEPALGRAVAAAFRGTDLPWPSTVPGAVEALRELGSRGHPLVVVSNSDGRVEGRLRTLAIAQVGDGAGATIRAVLDSSSVGVRKPDAKIFELALERIGVAPAQAVHVGDSLVYDVRGAEAAGVRPIHFDPWTMCKDVNHDHIRWLADLRSIL